MKKIITLFLLCCTTQGFSQAYYQSSPNNIILDNGYIHREIEFNNDSLFSSVLQLESTVANTISKSCDFSLRINDKEYNGFSGWKVLKVSPAGDSSKGRGVKVLLKPAGENPGFELELNYLLYPDLPVIRKWITIKNTGSNKDLKIESLNTEDLNTALNYVSSVVYHNYGRMKHLGKFIGNWDDPVVVVHDITKRMGIALGNEAVAVLKRTAYHTTATNNIEIGLTHKGDAFAFRKYIQPGASWQGPRTFIGLYSNRDDGFEIIDNEINKFTTLYLGARITKLPSKPTFVYNTWYPFRTHINDSLIRSVAKEAARCGITEFVIDDGWQVNYGGTTSAKEWGKNYGDWMVDKNKFSLGLASTFDYIKSLGMKPGLWISIASATRDSKVFKEHPEWFVENIHGKPGNLHYESPKDDGFYTASFGTKWRDYIKNKILTLVREYGLEYAKLDLAVVTSPYVNNDSISGSYAKNQPLYKDHNESFYVLYENLLNLFDELHRQAPDLFIDCTFETAGKLQLMDYAIAEHAEGNWLSNFEEPAPLGPLRVRQMAWWRSPALSASSLVIGNLPINDKDFIFCLQSLAGTLPIVLGDPRAIPDSTKMLIKKWSLWMQDKQKRYDYMSYRRDLPGFGEPREGFWDGWQRINFQTRDGGIFGVFRQGALETSRTVFLNDLNPERNYVIRRAPDDVVVGKGSGDALMHTGFTITLDKKYDGGIFEVSGE